MSEWEWKDNVELKPGIIAGDRCYRCTFKDRGMVWCMFNCAYYLSTVDAYRRKLEGNK